MYGLLKTIGDATLVDKSINDLYPKEYHGVLKLPNGKYTWAQYMGPGSRIDLRIPKGQEGLTPIDKESLAHDIRYQLSTTPEAIREADNIFNKVIDRLRKEGKESEFNLKQAELIKVKVFLEGNEILRKFIRKFNTRKTDIQDTEELTQMYEQKLKQLEQQGYGDVEMYGGGLLDFLLTDKQKAKNKKYLQDYTIGYLTRQGNTEALEQYKKQEGLGACGKPMSECKCVYTNDGTAMYNYQLPKCNLEF
ncbi:MAG: hypothetical protein ACOYLT_05555 [Flavobacterium sp.]|jgi:hypothetical protein|uniref:hypothetical protein n=1 Tax=Flavobacterium sp. TaxID=239 RepID=UPI003BCAB1FD